MMLVEGELLLEKGELLLQEEVFLVEVVLLISFSI